jgi:hypothetical protein
MYLEPRCWSPLTRIPWISWPDLGGFMYHDYYAKKSTFSFFSDVSVRTNRICQRLHSAMWNLHEQSVRFYSNFQIWKTLPEMCLANPEKCRRPNLNSFSIDDIKKQSNNRSFKKSSREMKFWENFYENYFMKLIKRLEGCQWNKRARQWKVKTMKIRRFLIQSI